MTVPATEPPATEPPATEPPATEPLSPQQEQIWFRHRLAPDVAHQAVTAIRVRGRLDLDRVDEAVTQLSRRHEVLRTSYPEIDGRPTPRIHPPRPVRSLRRDLRDTGAGLEEIVADQLSTPFDPSAAPLIRWVAVTMSDTEHALLVTAHHLIHEIGSTALLREFAVLYTAAGESASRPLEPAPAVQYRDVVRGRRETATPQSAPAYWRDRFAELPAVVEPPADRPRPAVRSLRAQTLVVDVAPDPTAALRAFCRTRRMAPRAVLVAAFVALLTRCTGQRDICVGSVVDGPRRADHDGALGPLADTVPLRCDVDAGAGFDELVGHCRDVVRDAEAHVLPFPELVRAVNPAREPGRDPLTDVLFSVDDAARPVLDLAGAVGTVVEHGNGAARTDLNVAVRRGPDDGTDGGRLTVAWEYATDLFDGATIARLADAYLRLLADALARPATPLSELALISAGDLRTVLHDWNADHRPATDTTLVHHAVRAQALRAPDAVAVREATGGGTREVGYGELVRTADGLAAQLRARGVGPHAVVGVCLPRGVDLVVAELAVLITGAAYLPLDAENPPVRVAAQYAAAGAALILTHGAIADRIPGDLPRLLVDDRPDPPPAALDPSPHDPTTPADLAYLIATSGSTGRPKIVMIEHGSLSNVVAWRRERCRLGPTDRIAQVASPGFDTSVMDIWPTLVVGATLHVPDQDTRLDPHRLQAWLVEERITVTELPTALGERVLVLPWPPTTALRVLITGGDRLQVRPAADLPFRVLNEYGPSETTATATAGHIEPGDATDGPPDIGRPITGYRAYVLDTWRHPVPPGVTGELWIGGVGVARGYLGAADLTAERFVPDPFSDVADARMYRTGDLVRHLPDGRIAFLGRRDRQLKLRGYRIEPAEIVEALRAHPGVEDAVVVAVTDPGGDKRLVAYLEAVDHPDLPAQVRTHLLDRLPRYMVPADVVVLDALPLNRNGKVDERALPPPRRSTTGPGFRAPETATQRCVAEIWCRVLRRDRVGLDDNFFDVGGHSLLLATVVRDLGERGHALPIVALFEHPTVQDLADHLDRRGSIDDRADERVGDGPERDPRRDVGRARLDRRRAALRAGAAQVSP